MAIERDKLVVDITVESKEATKSLKNIETELKALNAALKNIDVKKISKDIDNFGEINENTAKAIEQNTRQVKDLSAGFQKLNSSLSAMSNALSAIEDMTQFLDALLDPEKLRRFAKILNLFGNLASIRGLDAQAEMLKASSKGVADFADEVEKFKGKDFATELDKINERAALLAKGLGVVKTAGSIAFDSLIAIAAVGISRELSPQFRTLTDQIGSKFIPALKTADYSLKSLREVGVNTARDLKFLGKTIITAPVPGMVSLVNEVGHLGTVLTILGSRLKDSENETVAFAGKLTFLAGIFMGGFSFAIAVGVTAIGAFIQAISIKLFNTLDELSLKFEKSQESLRQFNFVIENFGKQFGTQAVGSLVMWNNWLDETRKNTVASSDDIRKSISLLVKESQILGFSVSQNQQILKRALDISAQSGRELVDVTNALVSGFNGNSQAVLSLGVDLSETALSHVHLAEKQNLVIKNLDESAKKQLRFMSFMEQTQPIVGSAALALDSLTGTQRLLNTEITTLSNRIGGSATVLIAWNKILIEAFRLINSLPQPLFELIGTLTQLTAILGIVAGTIIKFVFLANTIITVFLILNTILVNNAAISGAATTAMTALGASVGANIVPVNGLSAAFTNLNRILIAGIAKTFAKIGSSVLALGPILLGAAQKVALLAASLAPLAAKVIALVAVFAAFAQGLRELIRELPVLQNILTAIKKSIDVVAEAFDNLDFSIGQTKFSISSLIKDGLLRLFAVLVDLAKISISGTIIAFQNLSIAFLQFKRVFATGAELEALNAELAQAKIRLEETTNAARRAAKDILAFGGAARVARLELDLFGEASAGLAKDEPGKDSHVNFDKLAKSAKGAANAIEGIREANRSLKLEISNIGKTASEVAANQLAYDLRSVDLQRESLAKQGQLNAAVSQELALQKQLIQQKADLTAEQARLELVKNINEENQMLLNQQKVAGLEGIALIQQQLSFKYQEIDAEQQRLMLEDSANIKAIEALNRRKIILGEIASMQIYQKQEQTLNKIISNNKSLETQLRTMGLEGSDLAEEQLEIALERIDAEIERIKIEESGNKDAIKALEYQKKLVEQIAAEQGAGWFDSIIDGLSEGFGAAFDMAGDFFGGIMGFFDDILNMGSDPAALTKLQNLPDQIVAALEKLPDLFLEGSMKFFEAFDKFLDKLPGIFAKILDALPQIIDRAFQSLLKLLDTLPVILGQLFDALPDIISQLFDQMPVLIEKIFEVLPEIAAKLISVLPQIITNILDRLPAILEKLIEGLIGSWGEIIAAFVDTFITKGGIVKIAVAFVKAIVNSIGAIVKGFVNGVARAFQALFSGVKFPDRTFTEFGKQVEKVFNKVVKGATGVAEEIFSFVSLSKGKRAPQIPNETINQINTIITIAGQKIKGLWEQFLDALKRLWMWIYDNILMPIYNIVRDAWLWVYENVLLPIYNIVRDAWLWVYENVLLPIYNIVKDAWMWVYDNVLMPIYNIVRDAWMWVYNNIIEPLAGAVQRAFQWVVDNVIEPLANAVASAFQWVIDNILEPLANFVGNAFADIKDFFSLIFKGKIKEAFEPVFNFFNKLKDKVADAFSGVWGLWVTLKDRVAEAWHRVWELWVTLKDRVSEAFNFVGRLWEGLKDFVQKAFQPIFDFFNKLKIDVGGGGGIGGGGGVFGSGVGPDRGPVTGIPGSPFNKGGLVQRFQNGGFVPGGGIDSIAAMLTPGEFVFNRNAVDSIGSRNLTAMNQTGQMPATSNNQTAVLNIESGAIIINGNNDQPEDVANTVLERIKELSLQGRFVLAADGIRID